MSLSMVLIWAACAVIALGMFLWGRETGRGLAKADALRIEGALKGELAVLRREAVRLQAEAAGLRAADKAVREEAEQRRRKYVENDVARHENQMRFIEECSLRFDKPVNREASTALYVLQDWIDTEKNGWRLAFEVSMGAFIKTAPRKDKWISDRTFSSYSSKRVDFLLIDAQGVPKLVVEYNGTGHDLSGDAADRMKVKRRVLERVGLPLLEIPAKTPKAEIKRMIAAVFETQQDAVEQLAT